MCSKKEVDILHKIRQKVASNKTAHSMSSDNNGRIISLNDYVNNIDPNDNVLNGKIFIIVYFFSLKYCGQGLNFNENNLYFVEDSTLPWGYRVTVSKQNINYMNYFHPAINKFDFNPQIFRFIKTSICNLNLNYPFLNDVKNIIEEFLHYHKSDQEFMVKKTLERLEYFEEFKVDFNKIFV